MAQSTDAGAPQSEIPVTATGPSWHGSSLSFTLAHSPSVPKFGPRVGRITLVRDGLDASSSSAITIRNAAIDESEIMVDTPNILVGTSRGVVPHLSRDHTNGSDAIRWINVPFESFLEQVPPVPTLQDGPYPLHTFLGFNKDRHITSLCLRDPLDTREMPPNGNTHVSANCVRGVKKVTLSDWRTYVYKTQPDVVFALTDTPFTPLPYSQKRITKSIERSAAWLADLLRPLPVTAPRSSDDPPPPPASRLSHHPLKVFVQMAGGTSIPAREAFAYTLRETLHGPEADVVKLLRTLDEGVAGYAFDLAVLRGLRPSPNVPQHQNLPGGLLRLEERPLDMLQHPEPIAEALTPTLPQDTSGRASPTASSVLSIATAELTLLAPPPDIVSLLKASLGELPQHKPRLVTGVRSPHEMLCLVRGVGVDLFDVGWAMHFAHLGVALDFIFPAPLPLASDDGAGKEEARRRRLGHNLYDPVYARQFVRLADTLAGAGESERADGTARQVCLCIACSPRSPSAHILHSAVDRDSYATTITSEQEVVKYEKPFTRAYIHHLLQTHEMSAHSLLVAHNLAVVSIFLAGVREVCREEGGGALFALEGERFSDAYDESRELFLDARKDWEYVDRARGKGRLAREKEKQKDDQDA